MCLNQVKAERRRKSRTMVTIKVQQDELAELPMCSSCSEWMDVLKKNQVQRCSTIVQFLLSSLSMPSAHHNTWRLELLQCLRRVFVWPPTGMDAMKGSFKIQVHTNTHTTKSGNIQLVLGSGWLSLKFDKRLVGERRKLQTELLLV